MTLLYVLRVLLLSTRPGGQFAAAVGIHLILCAFLAGLLFVHQAIVPAVYNSIRSSLISGTAVFFAPLLLACIGLHLNLAAAEEFPCFSRYWRYPRPSANACALGCLPTRSDFRRDKPSVLAPR